MSARCLFFRSLNLTDVVAIEQSLAACPSLSIDLFGTPGLEYTDTVSESDVRIDKLISVGAWKVSKFLDALYFAISIELRVGIGGLGVFAGFLSEASRFGVRCGAGKVSLVDARLFVSQ